MIRPLGWDRLVRPGMWKFWDGRHERFEIQMMDRIAHRFQCALQSGADPFHIVPHATLIDGEMEPRRYVIDRGDAQFSEGLKRLRAAGQMKNPSRRLLLRARIPKRTFIR